MSGPFFQFRSPAAAIGFVAALALASGSHGQSVSDFRLPPATATPTARPVGPVDSESPAAAPVSPAASPPPSVTVPRPAPSRAPAQPSPRALPVPSVTATPAKVPAATRTTGSRPAPPSPAATPPPVNPPPADPTPTATATATALPTPNPTLTPLPTSSPPEPVGGFSWWWLAAAAMAGMLGTALAILLARGRTTPTREDAWPAEAAEPLPPARGLLPDPALAAFAPAPELALEAVRLSLSLVNATLHYRLRLTNRSATPLGPITLAADMISAHASLSDDSQLARDGSVLEPCHQFPGLAPGESVSVGGELRLPLAAIIPIRSGGAALLVPLLRLRIESGTSRETRVLVIGEAPANAGGLLRPFRLDRGPRTFSALGQRELER